MQEPTPVGIDIDIKTMIVERQRTLWQDTLYETEVQARVAAKINNEQMKTKAATRIEEAIRALDELDKILQEAVVKAAAAEEGLVRAGV